MPQSLRHCEGSELKRTEFSKIHLHCCSCWQVEGRFFSLSQGSSDVWMCQSVGVVPHKSLTEFLALAAGIAELLEGAAGLDVLNHGVPQPTLG